MENTANMTANKECLLSFRDFYAWYQTYQGWSKVLNGVNFHVNKGERVGLVGESGCGKTTLMKNILRTSESVIQRGEILYEGADIAQMNEKQMMAIRRNKVAMISQEPMVALNPVFTIRQQMKDVILASGFLGKNPQKQELEDVMVNAINSVMIPDPKRILDNYPFQLSGGMRQRICIAMALSTPRNMIIADEPGTALDVTIQDQIHRLLRSLTEGKDSSLIMITHSLGVVRELVDRIYIMYAGNIIESASVKELFLQAYHPYTVGLFDCIPRLAGGGLSEGIYGYIPDYVKDNYQCRFYPRCKDATERCREEKPPMYQVDTTHSVACFKYEGAPIVDDLSLFGSDAKGEQSQSQQVGPCLPLSDGI